MLRPRRAFDYSIRIVASLRVFLGRYGLFVLALIGAVLLVVAEFSDLYEVRAITAVVPDGTQTAGAHHGYALLVVAVVAVLMALGAVRGGSRPAAVALVVLGVIALAITLAIDLPDVDEAGLVKRETYEAAEASPQAGFYLETLGAVFILLAGAAMLVFRPTAARAEPPPRAEPEPAA
jgi:hypothetical protein